MKLLTKEIEDKLRANYRIHKSQEASGQEVSFPPVVKLFNPVGVGTWYLSELDDQDIAFGLCDLGHPEWGYVDLNELKSLKLPFGLGIERDIHWEAKVDDMGSEFSEAVKKIWPIGDSRCET